VRWPRRQWAANCSQTLEIATFRSVPDMASEKEALGTSTREDLHVLCYEHHTEMLPKFRSESAGTPLYACREPGCVIYYDNSQGYFLETQYPAIIESEIKPAIRCPRDGHLMYLAEVHPERKSFRMWKCPECNTVQTNAESSNKASSSG
jgi:hypothetical protein